MERKYGGGGGSRGGDSGGGVEVVMMMMMVVAKIRSESEDKEDHEENAFGHVHREKKGKIIKFNEGEDRTTNGKKAD